MLDLPAVQIPPSLVPEGSSTATVQPSLTEQMPDPLTAEADFKTWMAVRRANGLPAPKEPRVNPWARQQ